MTRQDRFHAQLFWTVIIYASLALGWAGVLIIREWL